MIDTIEPGDELGETQLTNKTSFLGYAWVLKDFDSSISLAIEQIHGTPSVVSDLLSAREIGVEDVERYLNPKIKHCMPDPNSLLDMELAVEHVVGAIREKRQMAVFGDYDVDGATSSAILKRFIRMVGHDIEIYIPDRFKEGYGPNTNALLELRKKGVDLVITVDCGTVAFEPIEKAKGAGLDTIVVDHHIGTKEKPKSIAVINPNRFDETTDLTYLCGAGVTFMMIVAINKKLREIGFYESGTIKEPKLLELMDLVALGTVADVVPLVGLNRAFVRTGLDVMQKWKNVGLRAIKDLAVKNATDKISEYTLGFLVGPRINAGGRLGDSALGARILSTNDADEAAKIAAQLEQLNVKRKEIEADILDDAMRRIESGNLHRRNFIAVSSSDYHQGVIGIIASRVKDKYNKPVAILSVENGIGKASCRSIYGVDIGGVIHAANAANLLICGGGHAMAGGFSVAEENLERAIEFMDECMSEDVCTFSKIKRLAVDSHASVKSLNVDMYNNLLQLGPFGSGNPKPKFVLKGVVPVRIDVRSERHLSLILRDKMSGATIKSIMFRCLEHGNSSVLLDLKGKEIDIVCEAILNNWLGNESVEANILDIAY